MKTLCWNCLLVIALGGWHDISWQGIASFAKDAKSVLGTGLEKAQLVAGDALGKAQLAAKKSAEFASGHGRIHVAVEGGNLTEVEAILSSLTEDELNELVHQKTTAGLGTARECMTSSGATCIFGETPFLLAAKNASLEMMELLIKFGANGTDVNSVGWNAFFHVVRAHEVSGEKRLAVLEWLSSAQVMPRYKLLEAIQQTDVNGKTLLHVAAGRGLTEVVSFLEGKAFTEDLIDVADSYGCVPVHYAIARRHIATARAIRAVGCNYSTPFSNGTTMLHELVHQSDWTLLAELDPTAEEMEFKVDGVSAFYLSLQKRNLPKVMLRYFLSKGVNVYHTGPLQTPLLHSAIKNKLSRGHLLLLLRHGAYPNQMDAAGMNALHAAALTGFPDAMRLMLGYARKLGDVSADVSADISVGDSQALTSTESQALSCGPQSTPFLDSDVEAEALDSNVDPRLMAALMDRPLECTQQESRSMAKHMYLDISAKNADGRTATLLSAFAGDEVCLSLLLEHGASLTDEDDDMHNILHYAAMGGHDSIAQTIVSKLGTTSGVSVNSKDASGFRPLHVASREGKFRMVQFLLDANATVDVRGNSGVTPLHLASQEGHVQVVKLLLESGHLPDVQDDYGKTPYQYANYGNWMGQSSKYDMVRRELQDKGGTKTRPAGEGELDPAVLVAMKVLPCPMSMMLAWMHDAAHSC